MANANIIYSQYEWENLSRAEQIEKLDTYYENNILYETERLLKYYMGLWNEDLRPLRTPVQRSVGFYESKICIGEPKVSTKNNTAVVDAVGQILEWSNFQIKKPEQIRGMALHGDIFRKVVSENGKVWHEAIVTKEVHSFTEDSRGFLTSIRIDTPMLDNGIEVTRTEYWTSDALVPYMAVWVHRLGNATIEEIAKAVNPEMHIPLAQFGIDFVPFVRSSFRSVSNKWGQSCVQQSLLKIDEANRQATKLHQMLFRYGKPVWTVSANYMLPDGSPGKVQKIKNATDTDGRDIEMRDNTILFLDGVTKLESLVPNIDYQAALNILLSQEKELEKDLPELLYYSLPDRADMSGDAIRNLLGAAVDRAVQAQSNYVEGTIRLNQMCITIGQFQGIFDSGIGSFDNGGTKHSIRFGEQFPLSAKEKAELLKTLKEAMGGENIKLAMELAGFSEEEVSEVKIPEPEPFDTVSSQK